MLRIDRDKKRAAKKEREIKNKFDLRQKMSVIATTTGIDNDEELHLTARVWEDLHKKGFEGFDKKSDASSESEESDEDSEAGLNVEDSDNSEIDDKELAVGRMAQEMEDNLAE
jgi:hypothetical protein